MAELPKRLRAEQGGAVRAVPEGGAVLARQAGAPQGEADAGEYNGPGCGIELG